APVGGEVELADVVPVHEDAAALELVEAGDELPDRGLAGARVPHQGDGLAGRDHEVERLEDGLLRPVAEVDGPELDAALEPAGVARARAAGAGSCGRQRKSTARSAMRPSGRPGSREPLWCTRGSASMRAKTRSLAERPSWNWLQNEAIDVSGNQTNARASTKR